MYGPWVYVKSVELFLENHPLMQSSQKYEANVDSDMENFYKFINHCGFNVSGFTNSINPEMYYGGNFFVPFDMSTSGRSNLQYMVPSVRTGQFDLAINFSDSLPKSLRCILFQEIPSKLTLKNGKADASYSTLVDSRR